MQTGYSLCIYYCSQPESTDNAGWLWSLVFAHVITIFRVALIYSKKTKELNMILTIGVEKQNVKVFV